MKRAAVRLFAKYTGQEVALLLKARAASDRKNLDALRAVTAKVAPERWRSLEVWARERQVLPVRPQGT